MSSDDHPNWTYLADFWGRVVQDYETVARKQPKTLAKKIQAEAIPPVVRGNVWQLMAKSKNIELEKNYVKLLESSSPFEKMIHRDLSRTFPNHEFFRKDGPGQESLFNVVKAYSIYDPDVGYCQGMGFVAGPLLLNMPEEEAFSLLVKLMKSYGLRGHYTPLMEGLSLRLYQFDKIVQELIPAVHEHLHREGVRSTMYASQWFMTLFAYRFPLELVLRVFDIIIAEGVDALLRFAVAILKKNQETINKLDFEPLLEYLKTGLFEYYIANQNQFVQDALDIKITKKQLANLTKQYEDELKANDPNTLMLESLKSQNKQLEEKVRTLETNLTTLNLEHVDLANQFIQTKIDQTKLKEQNDVLSRQVLELTKSLAEEQGNVEKAASQAKEEVDTEKEKLVERNAQLEEQLKEMEQTLIMTKLQFAESENARDTLARKLMDLKKALE
ncbi:rab-GTPase-TBC domain-containing protein [Paraphysoderma sedebokerense]|nr:rab-GTPase-TBC domain-containing protein [Paraphysoderma sedebokerense]